MLNLIFVYGKKKQQDAFVIQKWQKLLSSHTLPIAFYAVLHLLNLGNSFAAGAVKQTSDSGV